MGKKKTQTLELVRQIVLANEVRYRQNGKNDFRSPYALQFVQEQIEGSGTGVTAPSLKDIFNVLALNQYIWDSAVYDREKRMRQVASIWGSFKAAQKKDDPRAEEMAEEFDLLLGDVQLPEDVLAKVKDAAETLVGFAFA